VLETSCDSLGLCLRITNRNQSPASVSSVSIGSGDVMDLAHHLHHHYSDRPLGPEHQCLFVLFSFYVLHSEGVCGLFTKDPEHQPQLFISTTPLDIALFQPETILVYGEICG
jgi:hypothetical protein